MGWLAQGSARLRRLADLGGGSGFWVLCSGFRVLCSGLGACPPSGGFRVQGSVFRGAVNLACLDWQTGSVPVGMLVTFIFNI